MLRTSLRPSKQVLMEGKKRKETKCKRGEREIGERARGRGGERGDANVFFFLFFSGACMNVTTTW